MVQRQLINADLNLLVALQALLEERNVTRAAEHLFVSQPALSKSLQRLRELFDDPLFTRTAYGLIPTPRAEALQLQLPVLLEQLNNLIGQESFEPASHSGRYAVAISETLAQPLFPPLIGKLCREAPGVHILAREAGRDFLEDLAQGKLDFAMHTTQNYSDEFIVDPLGELIGGCMMRADHPLARDKITLKQYLHYPHVRLYHPGLTRSDIGIVDERLAIERKQRRIAFETTHFPAACSVLKNTDCLMVIPQALLGTEDKDQALVWRPLPNLLAFTLGFVLLHHRRTSAHAAHQWLRQELLTCATRLFENKDVEK